MGNLFIYINLQYTDGCLRTPDEIQRCLHYSIDANICNFVEIAGSQWEIGD